ncbi:predicted protein [Uncinocarpus reesii 1704]|uniref:Pentatricopeptide repeat-containing protein-mitochondrial domain-containing protein n=1 Tax=Uncinocarpus reesii (strain UAMH 1704) TaxID=336963 RepID=C4JXD5_UNCRE|nr:uncharacterized protein UREG_06308 [Uncinocarpus reesii 1704]EEP81443.1 predicted protein [Uncinocarpus reesii 1704]
MPAKLLVDGLWLCFRPSFSPLIRTRATQSFPKKSRASFPIATFKRPVSSVTGSQDQPPEEPRLLWKDGAFGLEGEEGEASIPSWDADSNVPVFPKEFPEHNVTRPKKTVERVESEPEEVYEARMRMRPKRFAPAEELKKMDSAYLEYKLLKVVGERPNHQAALRIIRELIGNRHVEPQSRHYQAMMLANADSRNGSALHAKHILEEMEALEIPLTSGVLHAALRVLAIHPDYLLRQEVLHSIRDRWLALSPAGWHNLVTGLLRERQYELALDKLERMEVQGIVVKPWLYSLVAYNLADAGEFDEVLHLMKPRVAMGLQFSANLWFHMLDQASAAMHAGLTSFIWRQQVLRGYMIPSYGVCNNVLAICARTGDVEMAVSVFDTLGQRRGAFTLNDYESLIETYLTAGDIDSALRVLCTMENTNVDVSENSTRSLLSSILLSDAETEHTWRTLKRFQTEENQSIPLAAADLAIEICAHRSDIDGAMGIYREIHNVCSSSPNSSTFSLLFDVCRQTQRPDMASFFLQEMQLLKILPTQSIYERLVLLCVESNYFEEARKYLLEMTQSGFALTDVAKRQVRKICAKSDDDSALYLQYDAAVRKPISRGLKPMSAGATTRSN